jgi:hypothetical protein
VNRRVWLRSGLAAAPAVGALAYFRDDLREKRVAIVEPGQIVRGAWQRPAPLRRLVAREKIRTLVTLTAINRHDPKYVGQKRVVDELGLRWVIVPMRGSTSTLELLAEAADLLAEPGNHPVFFHCVAGHHRSNLAEAAFRIRHHEWTPERAWNHLLRYPWTEPNAPADRADLRLIQEFARWNGSAPSPLRTLA